MNETNKKCPFSRNECSEECGLFINPDDLNDLLASRLSSLGVIDRQHGMCSLKTIAMSNARSIFEKTTTRR